jgi:hypothetical protein
MQREVREYRETEWCQSAFLCDETIRFGRQFIENGIFLIPEIWIAYWFVPSSNIKSQVPQVSSPMILRAQRKQLIALLFITTFGVVDWNLQAATSVDIPSLSVEEGLNGDSTDGTNSVSVEAIKVHISAFNRPPQTYTVQCFFLKKTAVPGVPAVDDAVTFDVGNCNDIYKVIANSIPLPPKVKPAAKGKVATPSAAPSATPEKWQFDPRMGYVVRILNNGTPLASAYASHGVEDFCKSHPEILTQGASSARRLEAASLVQSLLKK